MPTSSSPAFQVAGTNKKALFTLKLHRGEGMTLLAMNWKTTKPPKEFAGFAIEYKEPGGANFFPLKNRLGFLKPGNKVDSAQLTTLLSPIQKFRWVHFPRNAEQRGDFTYRVTPVFMDNADSLSYGEPQTANIQLMRETYPGKLNVSFTRGYVSSQAFVDFYEKDGHKINEIIPSSSKKGLDFKPTHPRADAAMSWMGFEARSAVLELLDDAFADKKAQVRVIAYDLNVPEILTRLEKLKKRLKVIIDDSGEHGEPDSGESKAEKRLVKSAGRANVIRQNMGQLQHNKTIVVSGPKIKAALCGSTNMSWRGIFVQANNAVIIRGANAIKPFMDAFDNYWTNGTVKKFGATTSAGWNKIPVTSVNIKVSFSPHIASNALLEDISKDVNDNTSSSLLYSLAFLYQTPGKMQDAILKQMKNKKLFVYGISDKKVGGLDVQIPDGNIAPVFPSALTNKNTPEPFKSEPSGGGGVRMHHKFIVIDFDKPSARVYMGSYNFSVTADTKNGENLLLIRDRRIATAYMIEALRLFDHYHFRVVQLDAKRARKKLSLARPPQKTGEHAWWEEDYTVVRKIKDRLLFS